MNDKIFIGIDPGASGGYAAIYPDGECETQKFDGISEFSDWIYDLTRNSDLEKYSLQAVVEDVNGFFGKDMPSSTGIKMGMNSGLYQGVLVAHQVPFRLVRPVSWQSGITGISKATGGKRKKALAEICRQRFPKAKVTLATADALLLADWLRIQFSLN